MARIALKFCGGCDPVYDRVEFWELLRSVVGAGVEWVSVEDADYQAVLLMAGCRRACPEKSLGHIKPHKIILVNGPVLEPKKLIDDLLFA